MEFAKPAFDVGFATNDLDDFRALWEQQAGIAYDHLAKLGDGFHQHRWRQGESIIKVNHTRNPPGGAAPRRVSGVNAAGCDRR